MLGIMKRPYAELEREWAKQRACISKLRAKGKTLDAIGQTIGITRQRVGQILAKKERPA